MELASLFYLFGVFKDISCFMMYGTHFVILFIGVFKDISCFVMYGTRFVILFIGVFKDISCFVMYGTRFVIWNNAFVRNKYCFELQSHKVAKLQVLAFVHLPFSFYPTECWTPNVEYPISKYVCISNFFLPYSALDIQYSSNFKLMPHSFFPSSKLHA